MYDLDKYYPSRYRRLLLNIAHDVLDQYKEKDRGVTDVQSARNTFNIYVYLNNPAVVKDRNYETILDDLLLLIDEDIQNEYYPPVIECDQVGNNRKDNMIIEQQLEQIKNSNEVLVSRVDDLYDKLYALEMLIKSQEETIYELKGEIHDNKY
jgi:hypothetical protein